MKTGLIVLITGASSGIGQALALHLASQGHRVFAGVRKASDAQRLLSLSDQRVCPLELDVGCMASVTRAVEGLAAQTQGRLDALVNNAGLAFSSPLELTPHDELTRLMNVNVLGPFAVTRACLPLLRETRGRIVNISSISGVFAAPGLSAYVASKHAVEGLTASLRMELSPLGVKVSSVAPGKVDTPIWEKALALGEAIEARAAAGGDGAEWGHSGIEAGRANPWYRRLQRFYQHHAAEEPGTPVEAVIEAVSHALHSARPHPRYIVGRRARLRACLNWLPTPWREGLVMRVISRDAA